MGQIKKTKEQNNKNKTKRVFLDKIRVEIYKLRYIS